MHVILANPSKHLFQVCHMLGHVMRLDDHVIHVDFNISSYLLFEDLIHKPLVCSPSVLLSERHDPVTKMGVFSDEGGFFLT